MYQLPPSTAINKPLYKKTVFEKFNLKTAERDRFDADISRMQLVARISSATVPALKVGDTVKGFYVLQVVIKRQDYNQQNILLLQKVIPQKIIFALQFEEQTRLCVFHTRLQESAWMPTADAVIPLQGLSLDDAWTHIVAAIGCLDDQAETTIEEQIVKKEQQEKLRKQIAALENKMRATKQPRRKFELHQQIQKLKEELK